MTSFLKKLSCYSVNKEEMKNLNVADKLTHLLTIDNPGPELLQVSGLAVRLSLFIRTSF